LDDAEEYIQSAWSKKRDSLPFGTPKSRPRMLGASKVAFLENYLAVSTWILDGFFNRPFAGSGHVLGKPPSNAMLGRKRFGRHLENYTVAKRLCGFSL